MDSMNICLKGLENYGHEHCLDPKEVREKCLVKKWGAHVQARGTSEWSTYDSIHVTVLVGASA